MTGLTVNDFPTPPLTPVALQVLLNSVITLSDQVGTARTAAEQVTVTKDAAVEELTTARKAIFRYAEGTVNREYHRPPQIPMYFPYLGSNQAKGSMDNFSRSMTVR